MGEPIAVVTGAGRGLGAAFATELATRGYRVGLCATAEPGFPGALCRAADVADPVAVEQFAAEVFDRLGPIDLWINNAGILGPIGPLHNTDPAAWTRCVEVNLLGTVNGSRAFLTRRSANGTLMNVASRAGLSGAPGLAAYSATKAAVIALTQSIAGEEATTGGRALVVIPPSVDTDMQDILLAQDEIIFPGLIQSRARRDLGGIVTAAEAAKAILERVLDGDNLETVLDLSSGGTDSPPSW